jgi:hypothetical protein
MVLCRSTEDKLLASSWSLTSLSQEPSCSSSQGCASNLSDRRVLHPEAHCEQSGLGYGEYAVPVPLETFFDYGRRFQRRLVPEAEDTHMLAPYHTCRQEPGRRHRDQPFQSYSRRLANLPRELVSHTSHHWNFGAFSGRDLMVIGGGQSALETAALAREQGANVRSSRQPRLVWNGVPHQEPYRAAQRLRRPTTGLGDGCGSTPIRQGRSIGCRSGCGSAR